MLICGKKKRQNDWIEEIGTDTQIDRIGSADEILGRSDKQ